MFLFEIELLICVKMDLALNNLQKLKPKQTNHPSLSLLSSPLDGTHLPHKVDECKFLLVSPHWCVHV